MTTPNPFAALLEPCYRVRPDERAIFGEFIEAVEAFEHGVATRVAFYPREDNSDGRDVEILCTAMPARFYTIKARPRVEGDQGFELSTGSGSEMARLLHQMALAAREGMLAP